MDKAPKKATGLRTAKFCIWTILYQDLIIFHFKVYVVFGTLIVLFLHLAGKIGYHAAMSGLFIGGIALIGLMWSLIAARKKSLLAIEDPEMREVAHQAMLIFISRKHLSIKEKQRLNSLKEKVCWYNQC